MRGKDWNWIFDWSGTLVDDLALVICATNHVMRIYERSEWERESFRRSFRLPYDDFYREHLPEVDLDELEGHFRHGFAISKETVPVLPHAADFLAFLDSQKSRMFVLSSMCEKAFGEQVKELELGHYFEETYAGVLDKRERIGEIISKHGLDPARTIFVGDMTHDVETAHHGGIYSAGVLTGYNHREVLESVKPTLLLEDLAEFKAMLDEAEDWHDVIG
ncbi:HAD family hydrolase [Rubritalea spongiae]|uniref:phosphoglycolate phosphatase n=1 Tax=Rubritalea spongiae TaxID=430797 RepID=A0ABW5E0V7_9BACT